jgi:hypothetical protein
MNRYADCFWSDNPIPSGFHGSAVFDGDWGDLINVA